MIADLLTSPEEDELSASLRGLLAARCPSTRVLAMFDGDSSLAAELTLDDFLRFGKRKARVSAAR